MIAVQINLYILIYNRNNQDFDVLSLDPDRLEIPSIEVLDTTNNIKSYLDNLLSNHIIQYDTQQYRLLNNIIIHDTYNSIYFCILPENCDVKNNIHRLPIKNYAIYSPNIQKIIRMVS